jgi:hypothetical protein
VVNYDLSTAIAIFSIYNSDSTFYCRLETKIELIKVFLHDLNRLGRQTRNPANNDVMRSNVYNYCVGIVRVPVRSYSYPGEVNVFPIYGGRRAGTLECRIIL